VLIGDRASGVAPLKFKKQLLPRLEAGEIISLSPVSVKLRLKYTVGRKRPKSTCGVRLPGAADRTYLLWGPAPIPLVLAALEDIKITLAKFIPKPLRQ